MSKGLMAALAFCSCYPVIKEVSMKKIQEKTKRLSLKSETLMALEQKDLKIPAAGYWSAWSVTEGGGPTCNT
jgi:hypothetical protein